MGTPMFAVPILKSLYQNGYFISVVYTQPPTKSKRGQKVNKSAIQGISETLNLDFRIPKTLKNNKEKTTIKIRKLYTISRYKVYFYTHANILKCKTILFIIYYNIISIQSPLSL